MNPCVRSITVRRPDKLINMNDKSHWSSKAATVATWRQAGFWWAKQYKLRCRAVAPVEVWTEFGTKQPGKRRDPINFIPTVKAFCDGFTDAAVWPDDSSQYVHTNEPTFTADVAADSLRITLAWEEQE